MSNINQHLLLHISEKRLSYFRLIGLLYTLINGKVSGFLHTEVHFAQPHVKPKVAKFNAEILIPTLSVFLEFFDVRSIETKRMIQT